MLTSAGPAAGGDLNTASADQERMTQLSPVRDHSVEPIRPAVILIAGLAGLSGLLYGYDSGAISGALPLLTSAFGLDSTAQGLVVSMILWGALPAIVGGTLASRRFDRRQILIAGAAVFLVGSIACALAPTIDVLVGARFFLGFAVGIANMFGLIYLSELAPTRIRGMLTAFYQLAVNVGILCAYIVGALFQRPGGWQWILGVGAIPAVVFLVGMIAAPASPRWLMTRGRDSDALSVLNQVRGGMAYARAELDGIKISLAQQHAGLGALFRDARKPLVVLVVLTFFQVFTGINAVVYYAPIIFSHMPAIGHSTGMIANFMVGSALVASTAISLPIIDRLGRVRLLAISMTGQFVTMLILWVLPSAGYVTIGAVFLYTFAFGFGLGPVFWLYVPEVLPLRMRAIGMGVITFLQYVLNAVFATSFPIAFDAWGPIVFLAFAMLSAVALGYVLMCVPETTGRSLEEVEAYWRRR